MTLQWTGIDHVRVWSRDVAATTRAYATLFGAGADADGVLRPDGHGVAVLPAEPGEPADRRGGLGALVLSAAGDEEAARLLTRRGLAVERRSAAGTRGDELVVDLAGIHAVVPSRTPQSERAGSSLAEVVGSATAATAATGAHPARSTGDVLGLDHVVVHTHHPDRALILWGARLGLDLRLDRRNPDLGAQSQG